MKDCVLMKHFWTFLDDAACEKEKPFCSWIFLTFLVSRPGKVQQSNCQASLIVFGKVNENDDPTDQHSIPLTNDLLLGLLCTTEQTSSAGGNETSLLTLGGVAGDGRGLTDVLVVTTTVRL